MTSDTDPSRGLHLYSLPNEVFVQILSPFPTRTLLPLAAVSQRFHALVLRLIHYRLFESASLKDYHLILECYHPTSKLIEPHVFCKHLGTNGLSEQYEGEGSLYENINISHQLGRLNSIYSKFRPEIREEERGVNVGPGHSLDPEDPSEHDPVIVKRSVSLEGFEDFSQLCVLVNVVKVIPGTSILLSATNVDEGVVRLFRNWLRDQSKRLQSPESHDKPDFDGETDSQVLWAGLNKDVGLKVRARECADSGQLLPVLIHRDEEKFSKYEIDIDELHIRTTRLLLTIEQALQETQNHSQAVVFTRTTG